MPRPDTRSFSLKCLTIACLLAGANSATVAQTSPSPSDSAQLQSRIIGGEPTRIAQVPATVALLRRARVELDGDLFQAQFCGGTLIAERWILTAAHCVVDSQGNTTTASSLLVLSGSTSLEQPTNQPISVVRVISHPEYQNVEQGRDIALLQLETDTVATPVPLDDQPVGLNEPAFIAGWGAVDIGRADRGQSFPKQLRGTFVNMTPGASCGTAFPVYLGFTDDANVCAGVVGGGKDSCQGDSGGPLYRVDPTSNRVTAITGITSWGVSCGLAENPGVYTNVGSYADWIREQLSPFNVQLPSRAQNDNTGLDNNLNAGALPSPGSQLEPSNDGTAAVSSSDEEDGSFFSGRLGLTMIAFLTLLLAHRHFKTKRPDAL